MCHSGILVLESSCPDLIRASIILKKVSRRRWMAGSSPAMTNRVSVPRGGRRRRTEADSLLRLQRSDVERQARHQEKTDEIDRNGLRRRGRPLHKAPDPWSRAVF